MRSPVLFATGSSDEAGNSSAVSLAHAGFVHTGKTTLAVGLNLNLVLFYAIRLILYASISWFALSLRVGSCCALLGYVLSFYVCLLSLHDCALCLLELNALIMCPIGM